MVKKVAYWLSTGIILFLMTVGSITYLFMYDKQAAAFEALGYPAYLLYPLALLKIIAILVIVSHRYNDLRDMVYVSYFFNTVLAIVAHVIYGDFYGHALAGLICLPISYLLGNQVRGRPAKDFFGRWTNPSSENA